MPYTDYTPEELAADEYFIRWVKQPDDETERYWQDWLARHPEQADTIREAKELVLSLDLEEHFPSDQQVDRMRQNLHGRIGRRSKVISMHTRPWYESWQKIAAVFLALVVFSALAWYGLQAFNTIEYRTAYGETQTLQLPDGSAVTLNGNSLLRHSRFWNDQGDREVYLTGEAFFNVKHLNDHRKFLVHTKDQLTVEVLGTEFNVFGRESGTRVILQSGKVKLNIPQGDQQHQVVMQPGELVELEEQTGTYSKRVVNPELASAWTRHKLIFDNTSIAEIVSILEETYGLRVNVSEPELLQKKVIGSAPTEDITIFLAALSKSFGLKIDRRGSEVSISSQ